MNSHTHKLSFKMGLWGTEYYCTLMTLIDFNDVNVRVFQNCKMPKVSYSVRCQIIGQLEIPGQTTQAVAARFNVSQATVSRLSQKYRLTGDVKDRARSGRPRVTTQREDRYINHCVNQNRFQSGQFLIQKLNCSCVQVAIHDSAPVWSCVVIHKKKLPWSGCIS